MQTEAAKIILIIIKINKNPNISEEFIESEKEGKKK